MKRKKEQKIDCVFLDRRTKLLPCQKEMVKWWHEKGEGIADLAKRFKVSRRLIYFITDPEQLEQNKAIAKKRGGWQQYYDKEAHRKNTQAYRLRKKELLAHADTFKLKATKTK